MSSVEIYPSGAGAYAVTKHGFGVEMRGTYTPNELFRASKLYMPEESDIAQLPPNFPEYYNYAWCPWARNSLDAFSRICERTRMVTGLRLHADDVFANYAGCGKPYADSWDKYYPIQARLLAFQQGFGTAVVPPRLRLLDLGCAGGRSMLQYHAHGLDVYGIEANPEHVRTAPDLVRGRVLLGDALVDTYMFNANTFNIIVCSVLGTTMTVDIEHLFREIHRLLAAGGLAVFDVPGSFNIGPHLSSENSTYSRMLRRLGFKGILLFRSQLLARKI